jgi:Putative MetA-pathway of phenol degradation
VALRRGLWLCLAVCAVARPASAVAQVPEIPPPAPAAENRPFTVSVGPGVTASLTYPGDWSTTLTVALGWSPDERWTFTVAPFWEREFNRIEGQAVSYDEFSVAVGVSYSFAPRWTVGLEFDFGIVDDLAGSWGRNNEFGIGVGVSYAFPLGGPWSLVVGPELAWKGTDEEFQLGLNTGIGFDF